MAGKFSLRDLISSDDQITIVDVGAMALGEAEADYEPLLEIKGTRVIGFEPDEADVWIDFNGDQRFEAREAVPMSAFMENLSTGVVTVPADAVLNQEVRLRVINSYNSTHRPCGALAGEVEDYLLVVDQP